MSCCEGEHDHSSHHEQVIDGLSEQQEERLKQQRRQKRKAEMNQHKKKYLPLLKFLKKHGLKFKTAAVKKRTVQFFRMDQFHAFLKEKADLIESNKQIKALLSNWEKIFIYYRRYDGQPQLKWPQQLEQSKNGPTSKFASFRFDSAESSKMSTFLLLGAVIALVLFPLWPYQLKYFLWKASLYILVAFCGMLIVRLILYLLFAIFGVSAWIFPRIFDNVTFLQSFVPLYSVSKWQGTSFYSITTRFIILSLFAYYGYHIYSDPSMVTTNLDITKTIIDDIDGWGIGKIKGQKNFSQSALSDYSKMYNQTINQDEQEGDQQPLQI